jgi:transmembrane sensor
MLNQREDDIIRYLSGNLTDEKKLALEKELVNNASMKALFDEYAAIWELTNQLNYPSETANHAWDSFQQNVKAPIRFLGFDWLKLAASILILAAFSVGIWFLTSTHSTTLVASNTTLSETLSDNSEVVLNTNSSVQYASDFNKDKREVWLTGEAYFNVTKSDKPFIVHTENGDIEVLGTKFDILTDDKNQILIAELYEGSILFTNEGKSFKLKSGQRLNKLNKVISVSNEANLERAWGTEINCTNATLAYILSELKINYKVEFDINPKYLNEHYTVTLPTDNLTSCLAILSSVSSKKFRLKNNVIVLE